MLIADTNEFHPLTDGHAYAAGHAPDGSPYQVIILRATYSNTHVDNAYTSSLAQARTAGLAVGHYGYMTANVDAAAQGSFFGATVKNHGGLKPGDTIWCDCEEGTGNQEPRVQAFLAAAHAILGDNPQDEGEYSGAAFYSAHLGTTPTGLHRWIAAYGQAAPPPDGEVLWQFTDNRAIPGISGNCDCSIFNGTLAQFLATFGATPAPQPSQTAPATITTGDNVQIIKIEGTTDAAGWYAGGIPNFPAGATKDQCWIVMDWGSGYDGGWNAVTAGVDYQNDPNGSPRFVIHGNPHSFYTGRVFVTI